METTNIEIAQRIMGDNFCGPDSAKRIGAIISNESLSKLSEIPYSSEVLAKYSQTHVLMLCGSMSLLDVWSFDKDIFFGESHQWFDNPNQQFSKLVSSQGWNLVAKNIHPNSTSKIWGEQINELSEDEYVPSTSILAQVIIAHYYATGTKLFSEVYARTSDVETYNRHVSLGRFYQNGLVVGRDMSGRISDIGLAYAVKAVNH